MKNKDLYTSYEQAYNVYYDGVVPKYGATRLEYGFGRWLWLECPPAATGDALEYWRSMKDAGILTNDGLKRLAKAEKAAAKGGAA